MTHRTLHTEFKAPKGLRHFTSIQCIEIHGTNHYQGNCVQPLQKGVPVSYNPQWLCMEKLKWIAKKLVVLWDEEDKRGWLGEWNYSPVTSCPRIC
jgi:hypothetical protein